MWTFARAAIRAYRSSFVGSFLIIVTASALLSAIGVLMETGIRGEAPLLAAVAASFAGTAILVVVLVVASTFSSALRQRTAQFALLRAVGATVRQVRSMITAEVILVFAVAAPLGAIPGLFAANLLTPALKSAGVVPTGVALDISPLPVAACLLLLFPTALLAARLAARRVTRVSPTEAVRGSDAESAHLSPARRITAIGLFLAGIFAAGIPFVIPGTIGSAAGATSAFLLISAVALAGPAIVGRIASRLASASRSTRNAASMLAIVNTRGFSRRLTAAIIPLALFLALGTVQTGVNRSIVEAAGMQLRAGLGSDTVITAPGGVTRGEAAAAVATSSISGGVRSSIVPAEVRVDGDGDDSLGDSSWEPTGIRTFDGNTSGLIDVDVTAGSIDELAGPATIAVSSESLFGTGKGVGDTVDVRFPHSPKAPARIVAVYERGLGFGDYLVDESSLPAVDRPTTADVLFTHDSAGPAATGLHTVSVDAYVTKAVAGAASQQKLSAILLFVLIFFIAIAAANTLAMLTGARKPEFSLLRRIGTTRRQLGLMMAIESAIVMAMALVIGTLCVVPALVGVAYGMLGRFTLAMDWPVYGALGAGVVLIALAAMLIPTRIANRVAL